MKRKGSGDSAVPGLKKKLSIRASLMTPIKPMLVCITLSIVIGIIVIIIVVIIIIIITINIIIIIYYYYYYYYYYTCNAGQITPEIIFTSNFTVNLKFHM